MPTEAEIDAAFQAAVGNGARRLIRDDIVKALEAAEAVRAPEWEYAVSTKWGPYVFFTRTAAEESAVEIRASIAEGRESGDLNYHGHLIRRRSASDPGPWEPVPEEEDHA